MAKLDEYLWDGLGGICILLIIYVIVRFLSTSFSNILKGVPDEQVVVNTHINNVYYGVSYWTERGGRPYQEDRHHESKGVGCDDSSLYAIFDGHGGARAAQYCKDNLIKYALQDENFPLDPARAIEAAFFKVDAEFSASAKVRSWTDGSTAIVATVHDRKVYVANAGDCRAVLVQSGGRVKPLSMDHKPNRPDEEKRIMKLGGKIIHWGSWRVQGVLAVSRAIGDVSLQPFVTCEPEVQSKSLSSEDEYLVLASDGVWDVLSNEDVGKLVRATAGKGFAACARHVCSEALIMGSTDNVTVLVIDLRNKHTHTETHSPPPTAGSKVQ